MIIAKNINYFFQEDAILIFDWNNGANNKIIDKVNHTLLKLI